MSKAHSKPPQIVQKWITENDKSLTGINLGYNIVSDAGQSIPHHFYVIQRRSGDVKDSLGGISGVIPSKRNY